MGGVMELRMLDKQGCLHLLGQHQVGRVVFTEGALPAAQPVIYRLDDERIVFRTEGDGKLAAALRHAVVAFEVDEIDPRTHRGWSVLGIGQAYEITDPRQRDRLAPRIPEPWAPGRNRHVIAVPLSILTGRRLALASWVSDKFCTTGI
jgi:nitroimidazol reductase NimA-like FMN-containing flavoprotein (pyridoxamine 5'-phosphate oxidase superfamily)